MEKFQRTLIPYPKKVILYNYQYLNDIDVNATSVDIQVCFRNTPRLHRDEWRFQTFQCSLLMH